MEDAFLQAIIDNPDDDMPRQVYADWLEEQGDVRAEFIRAQCEWMSFPLSEDRYRELRRQVLTLLGQHREEWLEGLEEIEQERVQFKRGLPQLVSCWYARKPQMSIPSSIQQRFPTIRSIKLWNFNWSEITDEDLSHLRKFNRWHISPVRWQNAGSGNPFAGQPLEFVEALDVMNLMDGPCPVLEWEFTGLRHLEVTATKNKLDEPFNWSRPLAAESYPNLESLVMTRCCNGTSSPAFTALERSDLRGQLKWLGLARNQLGDRGLTRLTELPWENLQVLDLSDNQLTDDAVPLLLDETAFPKLSMVILEGNNPSTKAVNQLREKFGAGIRQYHRMPGEWERWH